MSDMLGKVCGLNKLRTGNRRTSDAPVAGSRTQKRKSAIAGYTATQRKFGVAGKSK